MEEGLNLVDILKKAVKDDSLENYSKACKVDAIEGTSVDVTPLDGTAPILRVRILAGESDSGFYAVPKLGSVVVVTFLSNSSAFVSMLSEVEAVLLRGDQFGGLIKVEELKDQLATMSSRIDTIYDAINNGVTSPSDGGSALLVSMKATLKTQSETEDFENIENESVKHG